MTSIMHNFQCMLELFECYLFIKKKMKLNYFIKNSFLDLLIKWWFYVHLQHYLLKSPTQLQWISINIFYTVLSIAFFWCEDVWYRQMIRKLTNVSNENASNFYILCDFTHFYLMINLFICNFIQSNVIEIKYRFQHWNANLFLKIQPNHSVLMYSVEKENAQLRRECIVNFWIFMEILFLAIAIGCCWWEQILRKKPEKYVDVIINNK